MTGPNPLEAGGVERDLMTEDEHRALEVSGELAGLLRRIIGDGPQAQNDWSEAASHLHVVQRMVLAQAAARAFPDRYRVLGEEVRRG